MNTTRYLLVAMDIIKVPIVFDNGFLPVICKLISGGSYDPKLILSKFAIKQKNLFN